jgi:hypothetical protein
MVIHCKRPDQIPLILWGDMRDLSQILHIPGSSDSKQSPGSINVQYKLMTKALFTSLTKAQTLRLLKI